MKAKLLMITALLLTGALVFGQGYKGSVTAEITTEDGSPLPGSVAVLSADTFTRSFVSDANGSVRFVGLVPDTYELKVTFTGFNTYVRPNIIVDTGQNVRLNVVMAPSTQQEEMVVTAESPLMDNTKVGASTVLTEDELNAVPQSRDPWSVIMTVPGVQTDRVNVGGSEAGQQANFASKGDDGDNSSWVMDGVEFNDPGAAGASQSYLDFSAFGQMGVTTGGAGVEQRSGGAALNFVTKQGSNNHQGSVRLLYADEDFQASHSGLALNDGTPLVGNSIGETFEKSFELGGPIIKDRLWYWGAFSQNSITNILINGQPDRTELRNISLKIHGDITSTTRFNAFYTEGDKIKDGRGGGITRPSNTTWDQAGPTPIYKFEISQLIGQHTELSFLAARVDGGFGLTPKGGDNAQIGQNRITGVFDDTTFIDYSTRRPVRQYEVKGSTFLTGASMDHELSYGFQFKEASVTSLTTYGRNSLRAWHNGASSEHSGVDSTFVILQREGKATTDIESNSFHVQDTMTYGNWTIKAGFRYDSQEAKNAASTVGANPLAPQFLPEVAFQGQDAPFSFDTFAPRVGATYTWGDDNQYLVRGSYSLFYDTLTSGYVSPINPNISRYSFHTWDDSINPDGIVQSEEIGAQLSTNVDLNDPTGSVDRIDPDAKAPKTEEMLVGFEWSITPEFTVAATATIRERSDEYWNQYDGITSADYVLAPDQAATGTDPFFGGSPFTMTPYIWTEDAAARNPLRSSVYTNRANYTEDYKGLELTATKRLSNRWMMRANVTLQDWTRNVPSNAVFNPNSYQDGRNEDGGEIGVQSAGSGNRANVFFGSSKWTFNVNGLYQLPWDLTVSANVNGRDGFAYPQFQSVNAVDPDGWQNTYNLSYDAFDTVRADSMFWADFKFTKTFHMGGRTKVEIAAEIFNAFNDDTVIARELNIVSGGRGNELREVISPRVGRFSATVHF